MPGPATFLDYATVSFNSDLDPSLLRRALPDIALHAVSTEAEIGPRIANAEVVLTNKLQITRARMESAPRLKLIALTATGTNNVDLAAARERGIAVCNIRDYCTASVAQHALGVLLLLTHKLREYGRAAVDGTWARSPQFTVLDYPIRELRDKTLGIVGYGALGRGFARAAEAALGMRIAVAIRPGSTPAEREQRVAGVTRIPLDELLATADVISLHCPLTPATTGLIGARELGLMKRDAVLINTARGALIDIAALADALREKRIGGAAIDVLPQEPPVDGSALLDPSLENLIVTPHIAWAAKEARQRALDELAANVADFYAGGRRGRVV
jgi:glycerate dehydrogenase